MLNRRRSQVVIFICGLAIVIARPSSAAGQVAASVDEQGRTIYVNAILPDPVVRRHQRNPAPATQLQANTVHSAKIARRLPSGQTVDSQSSLGHMARQAAARAAVDPALVDAVIQVESEYNPGAVSPKGAIGLMQLIPATARRFGVADPFDPVENLKGGTTYLRYLLDLFGGDVPLALAAYNAGENAVLRSNGIPPFEETQGYVRKVTALYGLTGGERWPTLTPRRPIYSYVDAAGVVHFTNE